MRIVAPRRRSRMVEVIRGNGGYNGTGRDRTCNSNGCDHWNGTGRGIDSDRRCDAGGRLTSRRQIRPRVRISVISVGR